jgi:integrase
MLRKQVAGARTARTLAPRTVNKCLVLLTMLLNYALRHRWISHNPAAFAKKVREPAVEEALVEANVLSPGEITRLLQACDADVRPIVMTAVYTGLREGELLGLQWGDVDWAEAKLHVRRAWTSGRFVEPKTAAGGRNVDIPHSLMQELKRWKLACPKGDLVFPNGAGNPESPQNLVQRGFYPALRRAGLRKIRFHDLRHTYASLLLHNREPITRVSAALGHASPAITLSVYAHMIPMQDDGAAMRLDNLIGFRSPESGSETVAQKHRRVGTYPKTGDVMVAKGGIEPPTQGFSVLCSTN